jgi:hypothetical protein
MKYLILSLLFLSGVTLSLGVSMKVIIKGEPERNIAHIEVTASKYLVQSREIGNEYSRRANNLVNQSKISIQQSQEISKIIKKYLEFIHIKQAAGSLDSKMFRIGSAMLEVRVRKILNGKSISSYKSSSSLEQITKVMFKN